MVHLTSPQVDAILLATLPLAPAEARELRAALFETLLNWRREAIGDGELGRLLRELQRKHFTPPVATEDMRLASGDRHGPRRAFERG